MLKSLPASCVLMMAFALAGCASSPAAEPAPAPKVAGTAPAGAPAYFVYDVQRGDSLYRLGLRFGVPWAEIAQDNHIADAGNLRVGTPLVIRRSGVMQAAAASRPGPSAAFAPPSASAPSAAPARAPVNKSDLNRGRPTAQFWWPAVGRLARRYGENLRGLPDPGIAIAAPAGTEVCAAADGTVIDVVAGGPDSVWGTVVSVAHTGDMVSWYSNLGQVRTAKGRRVSQGEPIGTVGAAGETSFRLFRDERPVNPLSYLP